VLERHGRARSDHTRAVRVAVPLRRLVRHPVPAGGRGRVAGHPARRVTAVPPLLLPDARQRADHAHRLSPSYLRLLLASPHLAGLADSALDILPLGGEACPASDIAKLWDAAPRVRLFNQYGPTETTIRGEPLRDHPRGSRPGRA